MDSEADVVATRVYGALKRVEVHDDTTEEERERVRFARYHQFSRDLEGVVREMGYDDGDGAVVLERLWGIMGEEDRRGYTVRAVHEWGRNWVDDEEGPGRVVFDCARRGEVVVVRPLRGRGLVGTAFTVGSGVLLWGQMQTVIAGARGGGFDGDAGNVPGALPGGTITQRVYKYRCAARNGGWRVGRAYSNCNGFARGGSVADKRFGWVVYHGDVDPVGVVERCSLITAGGGLSNGNRHEDKVGVVPAGGLR